MTSQHCSYTQYTRHDGVMWPSSLQPPAVELVSSIDGPVVLQPASGPHSCTPWPADLVMTGWPPRAMTWYHGETVTQDQCQCSDQGECSLHLQQCITWVPSAYAECSTHNIECSFWQQQPRLLQDVQQERSYFYTPLTDRVTWSWLWENIPKMSSMMLITTDK